MKYLVTMELVGAPPEMPEELLQHVEEVIIPSHEAFMKLEAEGKILAGGDLSGRRGSVFILEADSNAEVSEILMSLPSWSTQEVDVVPLEDFEHRQATHQQYADRLRSILGE